MPDDASSIDDLYDPNRFEGNFPVWILFLASEADPEGCFPTDACLKLVLTGVAGEPTTLPIFTEWGLALDYIKYIGGNACGIPIGRIRLLTILLGEALAGVESVNIDPRGNIVRTIPIGNVIEGLQGLG